MVGIITSIKNGDEMAKKLTQTYIKKQISYFTKRHKNAKNLKSKLDYSRRIYFWENKLKSIKR